MKLSPVISLRRGVRRAGFTLLELVLAMLLLALLCGMIFSTANTNLALSNGVVQRQSEESLKNAFFALMSRQLSGLPGNTRMKLTWTESSGPYLSDLTLQNVPMDFTWGGQEKSAKAVQISTVQRSNGFLDIVLKYYENEIIQDSDNPNDVINPEPFATVTLLENVRMFEWQVRDGRTLDWTPDWDLTGRLPLQMELKVAFGNNPEIIRQLFWITPKADPETMMRQVAQQARQNPEAGIGGGGAGGGGGRPGGGQGGPGGPGQGGPGRGNGGGGRGGQGGGPPGGGGRGPGGGGGFNGNGGGRGGRGGGGQ